MVGAPQTVIILVVIIISAVFTEFTSNLACASILFPILDTVVRNTVASLTDFELLMDDFVGENNKHSSSASNFTVVHGSFTIVYATYW